MMGIPLNPAAAQRGVGWLTAMACLLAGPQALAEIEVLRSVELGGHIIQAGAGRPPLHRFHLSVVLFEGSQWTVAQAVGRVKQANRVFHQCDLGIGHATIVLARSNRLLELSTPFAPETVRLVTAFSEFERPRIFFIDSFTHNWVAVAIRRAVIELMDVNPALLDSIWVTARVKYFESVRQLAPHFFQQHDVLAHEIAHVLGDLGHVGFPQANLMHRRIGLLNNHLTVWQCTAILNQNPYVHLSRATSMQRAHLPVYLLRVQQTSLSRDFHPWNHSSTLPNSR